MMVAGRGSGEVARLGRPAERLFAQVAEGAAVTTTVTLAGRILSFLATIVLARLLAPSDFGLFNLALLALLAVDIVTERGLPQSVVQSAADFQRTSDTALFLLPLSALLLGGLVIVASPMLASFFNAPGLGAVVALLGIAYMIRSVGRVCAAVLERRLQFRRRAVAELLAPMAQGGVGLLVAVWSNGALGVWALAWGYLASALVWSVSNVTLAGWRPTWHFDPPIARDLLLFARDVTGVALLVVLVRNLDNAAIGKVLGPEPLGLYALAFSLSQLPNTILSSSLSRVLFPAFARFQHEPRALRDAHHFASKLVAVIVAPLALFVLAAAPDFIPAVYGSKWAGAVLPLQILALNGFLTALLVLNQTLLTATGHRKRTYPGAIVVALLVVAVLPLALTGGIVGVALLFTLAGLVGLILSELLAARALGNGLGEQLAPLIRPVLSAALVVGSVWWGARELLGPPGLAMQFVLAAITALVYGLVLLVVDPEVYRAATKVRGWRRGGLPASTPLSAA